MSTEEHHGNLQKELADSIASDLSVHPEVSDAMIIFRAPNGRIFASIESDRLDAVCGHAALEVIPRPYIRPCDTRPETWVSVDINGIVKFPILKAIAETGYRFVTARTPMNDREAAVREEYLTYGARIRASLPEKTYTDQVIYEQEPVKDSVPVPDKIREMRALLTPDEIRSFSDAYLFYKQAKFMEDYRDDFRYVSKMGSLIQSYRSMNNRQLRGYFGWRTAYRDGKPYEGSPEYAFILANEIINGIGWKDPSEGYRMLVDLIKSQPPNYFPHRANWVLDFCAVHGLSQKMEEISDIDRAVHTLAIPEDANAEDALLALVYLSDYKIESSKIMRENATDFSETILRAFRIINEKFIDKGDSLLEMGFYPLVIHNYRMFATGLFYDKGRGNYEFIVPGIAKYECSGHNWTRTKYRHLNTNTWWFDSLARSVDNLLRGHFGIKGTVKNGFSSGTVEGVAVRQAVDQWLKDKRMSYYKEIVVDTSLLLNIRRDADDVRDMIITEEERETAPAPAPVFVQPTHEEAVADIGDIESAFLRMLINGEDYGPFLKENRLTVDTAADMTNEAFINVIGDTVVDMSSGSPEVVEDYLDELEEILDGRNQDT